MTNEKVIADPTNREELIQWLQMICDQLYDLRMKRYMFQAVWTMIERNPELQKRQSHIYGWIYELYEDGMAMAIRRMCDIDSRTVSLMRFLTFVKKDPSAVSRAAYGALFPEGSVGGPGMPKDVKEWLRQRLFNGAYDEMFGKDVLQPRGEDLEREIGELKRLSKTVVEYATKRIAHFDKEPPTSYPSLEAIDTFIDHATEVVQKYMLLLKAVSADMGIYFQYEWLAPFRVTWLTDELWFGGIFKKDEPQRVDV